MIYPLATGVARYWFQNVYSSKISPNGRKVAYRYQLSLNVATATGQNPVALLYNQNNSGRPPTWSPTGDKLAINHQLGVRIIDLQGQTLQDIDFGASASWPPAWSPDGKKFAYTDVVDGGNYPTLYTYDIETGTRKQLVTLKFFQDPFDYYYDFITAPAWSPKGDKIAVIYSEYGGHRDFDEPTYEDNWRVNVATVPATGGAVHRVTNYPMWEYYQDEEDPGSPQSICWSPDGSEIAYSLAGVGGQTNPQGIYRVPASGGSPTFVTGYVPGSITPPWVYSITGSLQWAILNPTGLKVEILLAGAEVQVGEPFEARVKVTSAEALPATVTFPAGLLATLDTELLEFTGASIDPFQLTPEEPVRIFTVQVLPKMAGTAEMSSDLHAMIALDAETASTTREIQILDKRLIVNDTGDQPDADPDDGVLDVDLDTPGEQVTLRAALEKANEAADPDTIAFDIDEGTVPEITPGTPLPAIGSEVTIDGTTQPGSGAVRIRGGAAVANGLTVAASDVRLAGLVITEFSGSGIDITSGERQVVEKCVIGTDMADTAGLGNGIGIKIRDSTNTTIGSVEAVGRNIISSNTTGIDAAASNGLSVLGNFLGTSADGMTPLPNVETGITADACKELTVGATEVATLINARVGILMTNIEPSDVDNDGVPGSPEVQALSVNLGFGAKVVNVLFNVDATGEAVMGTHMETGVQVEDSENVTIGGVEPNAGNTLGGIVQMAIGGFRTTKLTLLSNMIGTGRMGTIPLPITGTGLHIEDSQDVTVGSPAKVTSIKALIGILLKDITASPEGHGATVQNVNFNLTASGEVPLGTGMGTGLRIEDSEKVTVGGVLAGTGNALGGIEGNGIEVLRSIDLTIFRNILGTGRLGTTPLPITGTGIDVEDSSNVMIGSLDDITVINALLGVHLRDITASPEGHGATVQNVNFNLTASGEVPLGTGMGTGLRIEDSEKVTVGGVLAGTGNALGGIEGNGIEILRSNKLELINNMIGTGRLGTIPLPITGTGIDIEDSNDVTIGSPVDLTVINALIGIYMRNVRALLEGHGATVQNVNFNLTASGEVPLGTGMGTGLRIEDSEKVTVGSTLAGAGNVLGGIEGNGIEILRSFDLALFFNSLGTNRNNTMSLPLQGDGVSISDNSSRISLLNNLFREAVGAGFRVNGGSSLITHRKNLIYNNALPPVVESGIGIDDQLLTSMLSKPFFINGTRVQGEVSGAPNENYTVDIYAYDPSASVLETRYYLGSDTVSCGADGNATIDVAVEGTAPPGWKVTFTLTSETLGTTSFSPGVEVVPAPDEDEDGIPDFWEKLYAPKLDYMNPNDFDDDPDGDGRTNIEEFRAWTNPTEVDVILSGGTTQFNAGEVMYFSGNAKSGRHYTLQRSTTLDAANWQNIVTRYLVNTGDLSLVDPDPPLNEDSLYYRVFLALPDVE